MAPSSLFGARVGLRLFLRFTSSAEAVEFVATRLQQRLDRIGHKRPFFSPRLQALVKLASVWDGVALMDREQFSVAEFSVICVQPNCLKIRPLTP